VNAKMAVMAERVAGSSFAVNADVGSLHVPEDEKAGLGQRCLAYAVDSVLLFGFCMAFGAAAFLVIFLGSDTGRSNITDGEEWGFVALLLATFPAWLAFNVGLVSLRGYTVGQYIMGLRTVEESGAQVTPRRTLGYWLALHPLLYHPLLALSWGLFALVGVTIAGSGILFVVSLAMVFLCLVTPLASLIFVAIDPQRRGIHDRLARIKVVQL
jgi:uncharacterized RDD family membrane protein YckC